MESGEYENRVMDDSVFYSLESSITGNNIRTAPLREPFEEEFQQACVVSHKEMHALAVHILCSYLLRI